VHTIKESATSSASTRGGEEGRGKEKDRRGKPRRRFKGERARGRVVQLAATYALCRSRYFTGTLVSREKEEEEWRSSTGGGGERKEINQGLPQRIPHSASTKGKEREKVGGKEELQSVPSNRGKRKGGTRSVSEGGGILSSHPAYQKMKREGEKEKKGKKKGPSRGLHRRTFRERQHSRADPLSLFFTLASRLDVRGERKGKRRVGKRRTSILA